MKIAVISDIHAYSPSLLKENENRPSYVETTAPSNQVGVNPFYALSRLISERGLSADYLVCCGDIADKAEPAAMAYAWRSLTDLQKALGASQLLVTSGNHDLDSRHKYNDYDARAALQGLPGYPFENEATNNEYWARNIVIEEKDDVRFVILNSSAFHGLGPDEFRHGRVSPAMLEYLAERLAGVKSKAANILVCHHHVYKIGAIDLEDYSEMVGGVALLDLLDRSDVGPWLILHGHRHWPNVTYAPSQGYAATVFSAGSFSAVLYDTLQDKASNQFYVIDIPDDQPEGDLVGTFTAWDWISQLGFQEAQGRSGLPHVGGFGKHRSPSELAPGVVALLAGAPGVPLSWTEVLERLPDLEYVTPSTLARAFQRLSDEYGVNVQYDKFGSPQQVGMGTK